MTDQPAFPSVNWCAHIFRYVDGKWYRKTGLYDQPGSPLEDSPIPDDHDMCPVRGCHAMRPKPPDALVPSDALVEDIILTKREVASLVILHALLSNADGTTLSHKIKCALEASDAWLAAGQQGKGQG